MNADYLNPQVYLNDYIASIKAKLKAEIAAIKSQPPDLQSLIQTLKTKYYIVPLSIGEPKPSEPIVRTVEQQYYDGQYQAKVFEIKVTIPYSGHKVLFNCKPATYTRAIPKQRHELYSNLINVYIELDELDADRYNHELQSFLSNITPNLERINTQVSFFNDELNDLISSLLGKRDKELSKQADFMEKIGLKVNPKSDLFMVPQPVAKKVIPLPVTDTTKQVPSHIIPTLQTQVYNDIREVIYNVGQAIERKPSLYRGKREEDLRDIFLLFLETRYESTTGMGEAFNKSGRTDILLKYAKDGSNLFVAECKYWKGQKKLAEAIDQLLGYLTYRDAKTALMIFVKQQDFTSVLESVRNNVKQHPQYKRFINATYNTSFAFEMYLPADRGSLVYMEFMLFHFSEPMS